jgi:eukaryotic-like serine/threonine-protein kinase
MNDVTTDQNLLFGILALQNDFITRDALVGAFGVWVACKDRPLGSILVERGDLDPADHAALVTMVQRHIIKHGKDPRKSLAAIESASSARDLLEPIDDFDVQASLGNLGHASTDDRTDADETETCVGRASATGGRFRVLRFHDRGGPGRGLCGA